MDILKKFKVIIVDNSYSFVLEKIVNDFNNIRLIKSLTNLGYGKAVNLGVAQANTTFILTINPDLILNEKSIKNLFDIYMTDIDNIGILAPSLFNEQMQNTCHGSISYIDRLKGKKVSNSSNNVIVGNTCCKFLMGSCYLIKRDLFNNLGGFDDSFFMYFEDVDLCDRTIKSGKYIMEVPSSKFIHLGNSSSEKRNFTSTKLSVIHKISSYQYLKKNTSLGFLIYQLIKNFFDYFQRMLFNLIRLRFKNSYKNFLRIFSLLLYLTSLYKIVYKFWKI